MVGQLCREGMDESDILPKAGYAMTIFHLLWISWLSEDAASPSVGAGRSCSTQLGVPKNAPKNHFLGIFYLCTAYKLKGEIHLN